MIFLLILGTVLVVFGLFAAIRSTGTSASKVEVLGVNVNLPGSIVFVVLGLGVVLLGAFLPQATRMLEGIGPAPRPPVGDQPTPGATPTGAPRTAPAATISSPDEGAAVTADGFVVGGSSNLAPADQLVVIVEDPTGRNPSIQPMLDEPCRIEPGGRFSCRAVYAGSDDQVGQEFTVTVLLVDPAAAQEFAAYRGSPQAGRFEGLAALPAGAQRLAEVGVVRR